jgi:hypothetical protein
MRDKALLGGRVRTPTVKGPGVELIDPLCAASLDCADPFRIRI